MTSYLREPLVHFIALGAALFIGNGLWQSSRDKSEYTIRVSPAEMQRQAAIFASENRREPDDEDLQALLFAHVEEQVLMKEAQRLGLDGDDTIIRRRLAQKMRFMINDVGRVSLPDEADLKDWYAQNLEDFMLPERRSFQHIFISPDGRGEAEIEAKTAQILAQILKGGIGADWKSLGDPFIMSRNFKTMSQADVTKDFGRDFARDVFALTADDNALWQGPIGSALGLHLVRISAVSPQETPEFEDIRPSIEAIWLDRAGRADNAKRLKEIIKKYDVVVED